MTPALSLSHSLYPSLNAHAHLLAQVDLSGLSSNGLLAFFLNLYHVLHFHIRVTLGEPRSLSLEQRTAFFSEYGYVVNGDKYSLNDIEHGILRGIDITSPCCCCCCYDRHRDRHSPPMCHSFRRQHSCTWTL